MLRKSDCVAKFTATLTDRARHFAADTGGTMVVWVLFMILAIMMGVGLGLDTLRTETLRSYMQNTVDRSILAAADLEQERDAEAVVRDYFDRAGLPGDAVHVASEEDFNEKRVYARLNANVGTRFIDLIGIESMRAITGGVAVESRTDVEISLILDNSGSMGWNDNRRLDLLKPAAKNFIDLVIKEGPNGTPSTVSMSIVPFSTQVNAGPILGGMLNLTTEHNYSQCVEFTDASYTDMSIDPLDELQRAGHFDIYTFDTPVDTYGVVCPFDDSRTITAWSQNKDALKAKIDAMWAGGNTSIDIATKWGAALLHPDFRPVHNDYITNGHTPSNLSGRPYNFGRSNTVKVLVVMSDGENTNQWYLEDDYASGASTLWREPATGILSYYDSDQDQYFVFNGTNLASNPGGSWQTEPAGGADAVNMPWTEVWDTMSVKAFSRDVKEAAMGGDWNDYFDDISGKTAPSVKNPRTTEICTAARNQGVVVYTIGMDTYGQGDATLEACAGDPLRFYDVEADDIDAAFSSIARQINQLRLTN